MACWRINVDSDLSLVVIVSVHLLLLLVLLLKYVLLSLLLNVNGLLVCCFIMWLLCLQFIGAGNVASVYGCSMSVWLLQASLKPSLLDWCFIKQVSQLLAVVLLHEIIIWWLCGRLISGSFGRSKLEKLLVDIHCIHPLRQGLLPLSAAKLFSALRMSSMSLCEGVHVSQPVAARS